MVTLGATDTEPVAVPGLASAPLLMATVVALPTFHASVTGAPAVESTPVVAVRPPAAAVKLLIAGTGDG